MSLFGQVKSFFQAHEPSSQEALEVIVHAMSYLSNSEKIKLKALVAVLDTVDKVADEAVATLSPAPPITITTPTV